MELHGQLDKLTTEGRNPRTREIDTLSTTGIVSLIVSEDQRVLEAVQHEVPRIVQAADLLADVLRGGGRILYMGSGTSGRLGVLDAAELLPTFGVGDEQVKALIAGGTTAMFVPVEQAEDDSDAGLRDFLAEGLTSKDALVGISASGRTPYVLAALKRAKEMGLVTVGITCNGDSEFSRIADVTIAAVVGPEVVTGSTRMKAGTAQKMILNTLSTTIMIKIGKVYQNLMVDMLPTNAKLVSRAESMVREVTGASLADARRALEEASYNIKAAIIMISRSCDLEVALELLTKAEGVVAQALQIPFE